MGRINSNIPHLQECLFFKSSAPNAEFTLNPLLVEKFPAWFNTMEEEPWIQVGHEVFDKLEWGSSPRVTMAYKRSDASWRKMLLCQPPLEEMLINYTRCDNQWLCFWDVKVEKKEGIRMGLAYDYMYQAMYKCIFVAVDGPLYNHEFMFDWREESTAGERSKERRRRIKVLVEQGVVAVQTIVKNVEMYMDITESSKARDLRRKRPTKMHI
ncbi:hypothetical protein H4I95_00163 [Botrytis cinerea]